MANNDLNSVLPSNSRVGYCILPYDILEYKKRLNKRTESGTSRFSKSKENENENENEKTINTNNNTNSEKGNDNNGNKIYIIETFDENLFTRIITWHVEFSTSEIYKIVLKHSTLGGRRKLSVDGYQIFTERDLFDYGSKHDFSYNGYNYTAIIETTFSDFNYKLIIENSKIIFSCHIKRGGSVF